MRHLTHLGWFTLLYSASAIVGCAAEAKMGASARDTDGGAIVTADAGSGPVDRDAQPGTPDAGSGADTGPAEQPSMIARDGFYADEQILENGETSVSVAAGVDEVFRVDVAPEEHIGLMFTFSGSPAVNLVIERFEGGTTARRLGLTDGGRGLRALAAYEPSVPRTFYVRIQSTSAVTGTLKLETTHFEDDVVCRVDCDRLMQLPLPNDPEVDGYDFTPTTILRYWFGRRDLVMFVRHAGQELVSHGFGPLLPHDFSQWDGKTPGTDTGSLRHASHQRGKDVDLSLYTTEGESSWQTFCETVYDSEGRHCRPGTVYDEFDPHPTAFMMGALFASQRVTMSFLDRELIPLVREAATEQIADGLVGSDYADLYENGRHLQHWPNHNDHIHIRVSEAEVGAFSSFRLVSDEPEFEAP